MTSLEDLALFVEIVQSGSLAAAARNLALPKSSVSRRLTAMEVRLRTQLIQRSTRKLSLTDAGHRLYERCNPLVAEASAAVNEVLTQPKEPHGLLRITATSAFGRLYVGPLLSEFLMKYPLVRAELVLLDRSVNVIEEGFDIAIRMGALDDLGLVARKLCDIERVLCASPAYLEREGSPATLSDLPLRDCLTSIEGNRWAFVEGGKTNVVANKGRLASNQLEVLYAAVLHGCGLAILPRFMVLA